ncbi:Ribosome-releasing factor 2, mitochondrial [Serendipita sp. 405]|nr:Ribosome-releasing factor 2, mitochondrial [Serendipita sp. 405]
MILGLKHTRTGDTLTSIIDSKDTLKSISPLPATISASVVSQSQSDIQAVQNALTSLSRTDPSVRWTEEDGQTLVHGLGALHLEIVEGRLKEEFGAHCSLGKRRVSYKECFSRTEDLVESLHWDKDVLGKPSNALIELAIRQLAEDEQGSDDWDGNLVIGPNGQPLPAATVPTGKITLELAAIIQGLLGPLSASPHTGLPITGTHITVRSFSLSLGSPPAALASASSTLLRQIFKNSGSQEILEPFISVKVSVPESGMGKVVKDLTENGGEIQEMLTDITSLSSLGGTNELTAFTPEGLYIPPQWISPSAVVSTDGSQDSTRQKRSVFAFSPLSKMLDYQSRLRSISGGQATFEMSPAGFRRVNQERKVEILQEIGRA